MINYIICDDIKEVREINEKIISKIAMPYDFDYKVYSFSKYDSDLNKLIKSNNDIKIYLLDIELPGKSGIEIAKKIREVDWDSIIIMLTNHNELEMKILKQKLLIFDFISKFDDYENKLIDTINYVLSRLNKRKTITFKCNKELHHVKLNDILYLYRDTTLEKTVIVTNTKEYAIREPLNKLALKLGSKFFKTHRACYVNLDKVDKVDFKNGLIHFTTGKKIDYLSRNYKKELEKVL